MREGGTINLIIKSYWKMLKEFLTGKIRITLGKGKVWFQNPERKLNTRGIASGFMQMQNRDIAKSQLTDELVSLRLHLKNIEDRDGLLFDRNPAFSMIINSNGKIENANATFLANLQYSKNEVVGQSAVNLVVEKQKVAFLIQLEKKSLTGEFAEFEAGLYAKDKTVRTILFASSQPLFQDADKPLSILLSGVDITARKKAEEVMEKLEEDSRLKGQKLENVLNIDQGISSILDLNQLVDFIIEKTTEILGAQRCSLMLLDNQSQELLIKGAKGLDENIIKETRVKIGDSISGLVAKDFKPILVCDIETDKTRARKNRPFYKSRSFLSVPIKVQNKIVGVVNVTDKGPRGDGVFTHADLQILCMIVNQAAISIENANYCKTFERLSTIDPLTGMYNRRYLMQTLKNEVERSRRHDNPMCLLMYDVDNFKSYNDNYGHLEGDHVLKEISRIVKINLRTADIICRYAGDEFLIVLPETNILQAEAVAKKFRQAVLNIKFKRVVTLSMGIAVYHKNYSERDLILKADQALYQSKKEGKDAVCCLP